MSYLTHDEYLKSGFNKVSVSEFDDLEKCAARQLNRVTGDFYMRHSLADDTFKYRVDKFKIAMAVQIEYLKSVGVTSLSDLLNASLQVSALVVCVLNLEARMQQQLAERWLQQRLITN
ncbi:hypothetical protein NWO25_19270 [Enterococcus lactis]|nr:hypothetical protein [Enterococcus lactis]